MNTLHEPGIRARVTGPIAFAIALLLATACASTQRPVTLNVGGGVSLPKGGDPGWNALAGLQISTLMQPIGIRVDGAYNSFPTDRPATDETFSATLNFSYRLPLTNSPLSPYVITGWGPYWLGCAGGCTAVHRFGWNAGLGTKFVFGFRGFLEARYHGVTGTLRYVPITLGFTL